jgi:hypothetical protein
MRSALRLFLILTVMAVAIIQLKACFDRRPQELPWTALRLDDPVGRFTAGKIAAMGSSPAQCRALLAVAGVRDRPAPTRRPGPECGYDDGVILAAGNARQSGFAPAGLVTSCPVATALLLWDGRVVQAAAERHFGQGVAAFVHAGSFSCRRLYGRESGAWSEHATADAVDILGFRLEDGRTVSVLRDWPRTGTEAAFLRDVRDGACDLFTTVLSPEYNAAHRDHLHLDTAYRSPGGWRACR